MYSTFYNVSMILWTETTDTTTSKRRRCSVRVWYAGKRIARLFYVSHTHGSKPAAVWKPRKYSMLLVGHQYL